MQLNKLVVLTHMIVKVYLFLAVVVCPALSTTLGGLVQNLAGGSSIFDNLSHVLVDKQGESTWLVVVANF